VPDVTPDVAPEDNATHLAGVKLPAEPVIQSSVRPPEGIDDSAEVCPAQFLQGSVAQPLRVKLRANSPLTRLGGIEYGLPTCILNDIKNLKIFLKQRPSEYRQRRSTR